MSTDLSTTLYERVIWMPKILDFLEFNILLRPRHAKAIYFYPAAPLAEQFSVGQRSTRSHKPSERRNRLRLTLGPRGVPEKDTQVPRACFG